MIMASTSLSDKICFQDIIDAKERIASDVPKTPLLPFSASWGDNDENQQIYLKLENLSPIGCFKLRGASNAVRLMSPEELQRGVYTASAGNFAKALSWMARQRGVACDVIVPDHAPQAKLIPTVALGGRVTKVPFDAWWRVIMEHRLDGMEGKFIHPVSDPAVIAGNGTVGLEIVDDLPDVDAVIVPYGGGGLACGIARAIKHQRPHVKVFACEVETAAPVHASLAAGRPVDVTYTASFVDGIGGKSVLEEMWPLVQSHLDGAILVSLQQVAAAVRLLVERSHVVAEGAGAAALAAALTGKAGPGKVVCVISGGNIDSEKVVKILQGEMP